MHMCTPGGTGKAGDWFRVIPGYMESLKPTCAMCDAVSTRKQTAFSSYISKSPHISLTFQRLRTFYPIFPKLS